jgi:uracil-DNA glycosylase
VEESLRRQYLEAMGIDNWVSRDPGPVVMPAVMSEPATVQERQPAAADPAEPVVTPALESGNDLSGLGWEGLQARVAACEACSLHQTRTQTVFGMGSQNADLMIIGEAPGADEDQQGEPFVGPAGQLLNAMLKAIGLDRSQVFIANILKCRPPENRDPHVDEASHCHPFLQRQIELVSPKVVLAVGRVAAQNLLHTDAAVGSLRNREHRLGESGIPLVVSYHPAYLLRSPEQKGKAWQDLIRAKRLL